MRICRKCLNSKVKVLRLLERKWIGFAKKANGIVLTLSRASWPHATVLPVLAAVRAVIRLVASLDRLLVHIHNSNTYIFVCICLEFGRLFAVLMHIQSNLSLFLILTSFMQCLLALEILTWTRRPSSAARNFGCRFLWLYLNLNRVRCSWVLLADPYTTFVQNIATFTASHSVSLVGRSMALASIFKPAGYLSALDCRSRRAAATNGDMARSLM